MPVIAMRRERRDSCWIINIWICYIRMIVQHVKWVFVFEGTSDCPTIKPSCCYWVACPQYDIGSFFCSWILNFLILHKGCLSGGTLDSYQINDWYWIQFCFDSTVPSKWNKNAMEHMNVVEVSSKKAFSDSVHVRRILITGKYYI